MKKIQTERPLVIFEVLKKARFNDPLFDFSLHGYRDELATIQAANFEILLKACKSVGMTYLFVDYRELCGCEGIEYPKPWPAIWHVAKTIGCEGSCGNSDQYQVSNSHIYFGKDRVGAWHVKEKRRLTVEEESGKKFRKVMSTLGRGNEIPVY